MTTDTVAEAMDSPGLRHLLTLRYGPSLMINRKYIIITSVLTLAPLARDILFSFLFHTRLDFTDSHMLFHTGTEMAVMFFFGSIFSIIDYRFHSEKQLRKYLDSMVEERTAEIKLNREISMEAFALLAEYREQNTGKHLKRVQLYVEMITLTLISDSIHKPYLVTKPSYVEDLKLASILHDIGKINVPNSILLKPGPLTDEEFAIMKKHTNLGGEILGKADASYKRKTGKESYLALARDIALYHHEKWDGSGYPKGLKEEQIPLSARIVALCDVYDAVTTDRVYKKAWTHEKACQLIIDGQGTHFDPVIARTFTAVEKDFDRIRRQHADDSHIHDPVEIE